MIRVIAALVLATSSLSASAQDFDLVNATLVDGTGAAPRAAVTVSIRDGKISAISERAPAAVANVRQIDLKGRYLLPASSMPMRTSNRPQRRFAPSSRVSPTARVLGDTYLQAIYTRDLIRWATCQGQKCSSRRATSGRSRASRFSWSILSSATPSIASSAVPTASRRRPAH
jgi:hypothetical protein